MLTIKTHNKLREEDGKIFWDKKWWTVIVFADLSQSDQEEHKYKYLVV